MNDGTKKWFTIIGISIVILACSVLCAWLFFGIQHDGNAVNGVNQGIQQLESNNNSLQMQLNTQKSQLLTLNQQLTKSNELTQTLKTQLNESNNSYRQPRPHRCKPSRN